MRDAAPEAVPPDCISSHRYHYPQSKWKSSTDIVLYSKQYTQPSEERKQQLTKKETGSQHFVLQLNHFFFFLSFCPCIYK